MSLANQQSSPITLDRFVTSTRQQSCATPAARVRLPGSLSDSREVRASFALPAHRFWFFGWAGLCCCCQAASQEQGRNLLVFRRRGFARTPEQLSRIGPSVVYSLLLPHQRRLCRSKRPDEGGAETRTSATRPPDHGPSPAQKKDSRRARIHMRVVFCVPPKSWKLQARGPSTGNKCVQSVLPCRGSTVVAIPRDQ